MLILIDVALVRIAPKPVTVIEVLKRLELMSRLLGVAVPQIIVQLVGVLSVVAEMPASAWKVAHSLARPSVSPTFGLAPARLRELRAGAGPRLKEDQPLPPQS